MYTNTLPSHIFWRSPRTCNRPRRRVWREGGGGGDRDREGGDRDRDREGGGGGGEERDGEGERDVTFPLGYTSKESWRNP